MPRPSPQYKRTITEHADEIAEAKQVIESRIRLAQIGVKRKTPGPERKAKEIRTDEK